MPKGRRAQKGDNQWDIGLWMGKTHHSDEHIIATEFGIEYARAVKRLPAEKQVNAVLLDTMVGVPWRPVDGLPKGRPKPTTSFGTVASSAR